MRGTCIPARVYVGAAMSWCGAALPPARNVWSCLRSAPTLAGSIFWTVRLARLFCNGCLYCYLLGSGRLYAFPAGHCLQ